MLTSYVVKEITEMFCKFAFILTSVALLGVYSSEAVDHNYEHKLITDLFTNYSSEVRPVIAHSHPVGVRFDLAFSQLVQLNAKKQILTSKIWIRQHWSNPFLTWNSSQYGGITFINISPKRVWKPDIVLYNRKKSEKQAKSTSNIQGDSGEMYNFQTKVALFNDGSAQWFAPTEVKTICKIDITFFPFDTQICTMVFGSWTYTSSYLNLSLKRETVDLSGYTVSGEWDLLSATAKRNVVKYSCCPDPFIDITYTFEIRRKVLFYVNNLIFPIIALAVLGMFGYFLPPESGERISLLITIMLGLSVYTLIFTENIPATSEVTPLLSRYSTAIMVELGVSLVLSCVVVGVYHGDCSKQMPKWFEFLIFNILAKMFQQLQPMEAESRRKDNQKSNGMIKNDPIPIYFALNRREPQDQRGADSRLPTDHEPHSAVSLHKKLDDVVTKLDSLLQNNESQNDEDRSKKWHFAARVLDKTIFWIYTLTVIISTIALSLFIPYDITT